MAEMWINTKGKKFVGQTAAVPAPDEKSAVIVDYSDLEKMVILADISADPSEAANDATQTVTVTAVMSLDGVNAYANWGYDFLFSCDASGLPVTLSNKTQVTGGYSVDVTFPVGVTEGQNAVIKLLTDDHSVVLSVAVVA